MVPSTALVSVLAAIGGVSALPAHVLGERASDTQTAITDPTSLRNTLDLSQYSPIKEIQVGPRPYYLVDNMKDSALKTKLQKCSNKRMKTTTFSVAHRGGGTLQFPEHTLESNLAGARMGAGVLECDVAFTKDRQLVCRHSQCDLHTTTNVVTIPELNAKCTTPFVAANGTAPAKAKCCTSDFTLAEFKTLCGKMDSSFANATTPEEYLGGIAEWRTSLYNQCGTLLTHKEHIELATRLGLEMTPELKTPQVPMPFDGDYTQEKYAQQLVDEYHEMGVDLKKVWGQSFLYADMLYWIKNEPEFAKNAMYLDETAATDAEIPNATALLKKYAQDGVKHIAPPLQYLLTAENGEIVPSDYAKEANRLKLGIVTWSLDRSGPLAKAAKAKDYYLSAYAAAVTRDGDMYNIVDVLARKIGVRKIFSDWSATTTYYANCMGFK
jgi:glycerophosphoryl diester phosphodiesterase